MITPVNPTLEERIGIVMRRLVLIRASASVNTDELTPMTESDIADAIMEAAREAHDILEPISDAKNFNEISEWTPTQKGAAR